MRGNAGRTARSKVGWEVGRGGREGRWGDGEVGRSGEEWGGVGRNEEEGGERGRGGGGEGGRGLGPRHEARSPDLHPFPKLPRSTLKSVSPNRRCYRDGGWVRARGRPNLLGNTCSRPAGTLDFF